MRIFETALLRGPRFLIEQAEAEGVDRAVLLREAGLRPEEIAEPDARIPVSRFADLWRALLSHLPRRDLGVRFGTRFELARGGLVGYLFLNSSDLRTALERLVRFGGILNEAVRPSFEAFSGGASLSLAMSPLFKLHPQIADWILSALLTSMREATRTDLRPRQVSFPYRAPRPVPSAHRDHFGAGLRFSGERAEVALTEGQLALPIVGADTELGVYLERHAEEVLARLSSEPELLKQVHHRIWQDLRGGRPTLDGTAAGLGMSARSLQRRLRAEGTSFAEVRDEILRHLATSLLRDRSVAIHEIAVLLGYSEPSTFYRAFRRWSNTSPLEYRAAS